MCIVHAFIRHCLAYIYLHLIEEDLKQFLKYWNTHYIRKSRGAICPGGVPDDLFKLHEYYGN